MTLDEINVGKWKIPDEMFERYLRVIKATERSGSRYNYEFDVLRQDIHKEIMDYTGLSVYMKDYREFQKALEDLCEDELSMGFIPPIVTKLNSPPAGLTSGDDK